MPLPLWKHKRYAVPAALAQSDEQPRMGEFRVCTACHSIEPGRHFTGPSLAKLFGRKAGTVPDFQRYSDALKRSEVTWTEQTLDQWLRNPAAFIPGNGMVFPGVWGPQSGA